MIFVVFGNLDSFFLFFSGSWYFWIRISKIEHFVKIQGSSSLLLQRTAIVVVIVVVNVVFVDDFKVIRYGQNNLEKLINNCHYFAFFHFFFIVVDRKKVRFFNFAASAFPEPGATRTPRPRSSGGRASAAKGWPPSRRSPSRRLGVPGACLKERNKGCCKTEENTVIVSV